jgi:transposase
VSELYKLDCSMCDRTVTVPPQDGRQTCPACGAVLHIQWNAARSELERPAA